MSFCQRNVFDGLWTIGYWYMYSSPFLQSTGIVYNLWACPTQWPPKQIFQNETLKTRVWNPGKIGEHQSYHSDQWNPGSCLHSNLST